MGCCNSLGEIAVLALNGGADPARTTRHAFLDRYCESGTVVMPAHFPSPSFGHVVRDGDGYGWRYIGEE